MYDGLSNQSFSLHKMIDNRTKQMYNRIIEQRMWSGHLRTQTAKMQQNK